MEQIDKSYQTMTGTLEVITKAQEVSEQSEMVVGVSGQEVLEQDVSDWEKAAARTREVVVSGQEKMRAVAIAMAKGVSEQEA